MSGSVRFEWPDFWAYYVRIEDCKIQGDMLKQVKEIYDSVSNEFKGVILEHAPVEVRQTLGNMLIPAFVLHDDVIFQKPQKSLESIRSDFNSRFSRRK